MNPFIQCLEFYGKGKYVFFAVRLKNLSFTWYVWNLMVYFFELRHLLVKSSDVGTQCLRADSLR